MILIHRHTDEKNDYHRFSTDRSVSVGIARSTNPGRYVWSIYHPDIRCAIGGDESDSMESAKAEAEDWIFKWVKARRTSPPASGAA